jgi:hypothetical protein
VLAHLETEVRIATGCLTEDPYVHWEDNKHPYLIHIHPPPFFSEPGFFDRLENKPNFILAARETSTDRREVFSDRWFSWAKPISKFLKEKQMSVFPSDMFVVCSSAFRLLPPALPYRYGVTLACSQRLYHA